MRMEVAEEIVVSARKEAKFYFLFSTSQQQEYRCDGSARAATLGHEMEIAG